MTSRWLSFLLAVYFLASAAVLATWTFRDAYSFTGDEPHYLVMADALVRDRTADVSAAYEREFANPAIYPLGLARPNQPLAPPAAHIDMSDEVRGTYSWHGLGVALLVAVPFALFGSLGAKLSVILVCSLVVVAAWRLAAVLMPRASERARAATVSAAALGYPFLVASTQIYPDLMGGALLLFALSFVLLPARTALGSTAAALPLAILPWLGMKFALAAAIMFAALIWRSRQRVTTAITFAGPVMVLAVWQHYVYGSALGATVNGALALTPEAGMVFLGLLVDQNQGLLMLSPPLWLGVLGLAAWWKRDRLASAAWAGAFLALWLPSALHPGLYGLGSFVGRYGWALAALMIVPTIVTFDALFRRGGRMFPLAVAACLVINGIVVAWSAFVTKGGPGQPAGLDLYTKPAETWLESYPVFAYPLQHFLPALYDVSWAPTFWPNLAWAVAVVSVATLGWQLGRTSPRLIGRWVGSIVAAIGALVIVSGLAATPGPRLVVTEAGANLSFEPDIDAAGVVVAEPSWLMRDGHYKWSFTYSSAAPPTKTIGDWRLVNADGNVVASGEVNGSNGEVATSTAVIAYRSLRPASFTWQIAWYGTMPMSVREALIIQWFAA